MKMNYSIFVFENSNLSDVFVNLKQGMTTLLRQRFLIVIGLTESFFLIILHIFSFSWGPVLKGLFDDEIHSDPFTLFMICIIIGGTAFRVIEISNLDSFSTLSM